MVSPVRLRDDRSAVQLITEIARASRQHSTWHGTNRHLAAYHTNRHSATKHQQTWFYC